MLEFEGDAICLSGSLGTGLKSQIFADYYPFWWRITSGGERLSHSLETSIVELNAATGEIYLKDGKKLVLGSAGHAMKLKMLSDDTRNLNIILVEEQKECFDHLKRVIRRRWPDVTLKDDGTTSKDSDKSIFLLNNNLDSALNSVYLRGDLGNSLFFFDPLDYVKWDAIEKVAKRRILTPYARRTEFIIFLFSTDWFLGRDSKVALPITDSSKWNKSEKDRVEGMNECFGNSEWQPSLLTDRTIQDRVDMLVSLYEKRLHRWFRYVLPMPFAPKQNQIYHLFLCSNFCTGVRETKDHYSKLTKNPTYAPDNSSAYTKFTRLHPQLLRGLSGNSKPLPWKILWHTLRNHEGGYLDRNCSEQAKEDSNSIEGALSWLHINGYSAKLNTSDNPWKSVLPEYVLSWKVLNDRLGVGRPVDLSPLTSDKIIEK